MEAGERRVAAYLYPSDPAACLDLSELHGQFVLTKIADSLPAQWSRYKIGDRWLACHVRLPVITIPCSQRDAFVIVVGYLVDARLGCVNFSSGLAGAESFFDAVENLLYFCSGRFVCIASDGVSIRLYPDASGSLAVLYSSFYRVAASTIHLFPPADAEDDQVELIEDLDIAQNSKALLFGLTPRKSIARLLPNHYLDLDTWAATRFWPKRAISILASAESALEEVAELLRASIEAFVTVGFRPWMSLTAGYDSRALLAVSRAFAAKIRWFTWELPDSTGRQDVMTAARLAAVHGLDYREFAFQESSGSEQRQWLLRAGLSVGENRGKSLVTTVESMGSDSVYLPGLAAEVGWGLYAKKLKDDVPLENTIVQLAHEYSIKSTDQLAVACSEWMASLPVQSDLNMLSFFYLEQRLGCWAGVTAYGHAKGPTRIHPYSNRRIFEILMSLPMEMRADKTFLVEIIRQCWPQLLNLPFG